MNTIVRPAPPPPPLASGIADLREVHRAASELRRGAPVLLLHPHGALAVVAAETAERPVLDELRALAPTPPVLLLAHPRAQALLSPTLLDPALPDPALPGPTLPGAPPADPAPLVVALRVAGALDPALLHSLADPTWPQPPADLIHATLSIATPPALAAHAVQLAKIARLLPAVLALPLAADAAETIDPGLLRVRAGAIAAYPETASTGLRRVADAAVPLDSAPDARIIAFRPLDGATEHLAIVVGHPERVPAPLLRLHSACLTGDVLGSLRCDCGPQLRAALARITAEGAGVLLYLAQEGRGIGLVNKLRAYALQDRGQDTVDANLSLGWEIDERSFLPAAIMLEQLGLRRVRLLTNNPAKRDALEAHGIDVAERLPLVTQPNGINDSYLHAKATRLGHLL